jgi:hypothetical protein
MNSTIVESATLATIVYDGDRELLQLKFRSREIYEYFSVPAAVHQALLQAPSKGSFFNRVIGGRFCYSLVSNAGVSLPHRSQR